MKDAKGHGSNSRGGAGAAHQTGVRVALSAKAETIAKGQRVDNSHFPPRTDAGVAAITDQSRTQGSQTATPGRFRFQQGK